MSNFASRRKMMVDTQIRPSDVTKFPIIEAMLSVPREAYMPDGRRDSAYVGKNVPISRGRVVLDPLTFARMLDVLDLQPTELVLDLGCGPGYSTAIAGRITGTVVAVEEDEELARRAQDILSNQGVDNAIVIHGSLADGAPKYAPYDAMMIQGGIGQLPDSLADQLREGGRIAAIHVKGHLGTLCVGYKLDGVINWRRAFNAMAPVLPGFARPVEFAL